MDLVSPRQIEQFRRRLEDELRSLYHAVHGDIREARRSFEQDEPRDEVDESQRVQLRDLGVRLAETDAARAQLIEEALARIDAGTFGKCVECGGEIGIERLKLVPWTSRCVDDQESLEAEARQRPPTL